MAFGKKLEAALKMKNIRPGTLATKTGINKNTIYSIIQRDTAKVDLAVITTIAEALDMDIGYFLTPDPEEKEELKKIEPIKTDGLNEREERFINAFSALSRQNQHTILVIAEALLRDQSKSPDSEQ